MKIDEKLLKEAMKLTGSKSAKATIEEALQFLIRFKKQIKIKDLKGKLRWEGDLDESRQGR